MGRSPGTRRSASLALAFPLLVGVHLALLALDAPRGVVAPVAVVTWFGGPALLAVGLMLLSRRVQSTLRPSSTAGRLSLWLLAAAAGAFLVFVVLLVIEAGPDSPDEFFDNLWLAIPLLLTGAFALAGGGVGGYAVVRQHERSASVVGVIAFGLVVGVFAIAELGTDEPRGDGGGPNSHTNILVSAEAPGAITVGFDYTYASDPGDATITAIAVTAIGDDGGPLAGVEPVLKPIERGSGHMDVTFPLTPGQLERLDGFTICFTGDDEPDLGCVRAPYRPS